MDQQSHIHFMKAKRLFSLLLKQLKENKEIDLERQKIQIQLKELHHLDQTIKTQQKQLKQTSTQLFDNSHKALKGHFSFEMQQAYDHLMRAIFLTNSPLSGSTISEAEIMQALNRIIASAPQYSQENTHHTQQLLSKAKETVNQSKSIDQAAANIDQQLETAKTQLVLHDTSLREFKTSAAQLLWNIADLIAHSPIDHLHQKLKSLPLECITLETVQSSDYIREMQDFFHQNVTQDFTILPEHTSTKDSETSKDPHTSL